jgi:hypothetical protein
MTPKQETNKIISLTKKVSILTKKMHKLEKTPNIPNWYSKWKKLSDERIKCYDKLHHIYLNPVLPKSKQKFLK